MTTTGTTSADRAVTHLSPDGFGSITINSMSDNMASYVGSVGGADATPYTIRYSGGWWTPGWTYIPPKWPSHWVPPHGWTPPSDDDGIPIQVGPNIESPSWPHHPVEWVWSGPLSDTPTSVADARRLIAEHELAIERCKAYIEEQRRELEEGK